MSHNQEVAKLVSKLMQLILRAYRSNHCAVLFYLTSLCYFLVILSIRVVAMNT